MPLGDNVFQDAQVDFTTLLAMHGETVTVCRTSVPVSELDAFGEPVGGYSPEQFAAQIVVVSTELVETLTAGGGKNVERLTFVAAHGVILENDELVYNGHTYKVMNVNTSTMGALDIADEGIAQREVAA